MHPFSPFPFMPCHVLAFNAVSGMEEEEPFDPDNARDAIKCCLCPCYHGGIKPTTDGRCRCCWCWCWWWWCRGYLNTPSLTHTYPLTHTHTLSPSHTLSLSLLSTPPHYHYHCHYHYYHPPSLSLSLLSPPITPHHYHCHYHYYHPPSLSLPPPTGRWIHLCCAVWATATAPTSSSSDIPDSEGGVGLGSGGGGGSVYGGSASGSGGGGSVAGGGGGGGGGANITDLTEMGPVDVESLQVQPYREVCTSLVFTPYSFQ